MTKRKHSVEIRNKVDNRGWDGPSYSVEILVDGEVVSSGAYGGEPEDNNKFRDYDWVEHALVAVAEKLGAKVEVTEWSEDEES